MKPDELRHVDIINLCVECSLISMTDSSIHNHDKDTDYLQNVSGTIEWHALKILCEGGSNGTGVLFSWCTVLVLFETSKLNKVQLCKNCSHFCKQRKCHLECVNILPETVDSGSDLHKPTT